ncbi:MAG: helix-turn-helix transcriptional regulator [bacterium]
MTAAAPARLSRLLALVPWLQQHSGVSLDEAAEHFGVTQTELERDLWLVVCCGLPGHGPDQLIDIQFWDDGEIHVIDPQTLARPLTLTGDEVAALLIGLRLLAQVPGDHDRGALASATAKLEQAGYAVPSEQAMVVDATAHAVRAAVDAALRDDRALRIEYLGSTRDELTERTIDVRRVLTQDGHAYLDAWCRRAGAERTFRMDRIISATVVPEPRALPQEARGPISREEILAPGSATSVLVEFTPAGRWLLDVLRGDLLEDREDGGGTLRADVADPAWLVRLVLAQGGDLVVRAPADLRASVREAAEAALARYAPGGR